MRIADTILVIDDDKVAGEIVSALAHTMGLRCVTATEPSAFLDLALPDTTLILLDLIMPDLDGIEVLRLLGKRQCRAGIVLMSGVNIRVLEQAHKLADALGLSVIGHLQKPFPLTALRKLLASNALSGTPETLAERPPLTISDDQLRAAFQREEFVLYYQPQINIATGRVTGIEALCRWQHPEFGLVYPDSFISRIEALGLMDRFCWFTANRGLAELKQFIGPDGVVPRLALNVSVSSLADLKFPDIFLELLKVYDIPAECIAIEITETGLIEFSYVLDVLARLRLKNIPLSIDDFGTGYSMMQQLQNVPAMELKIDKGFVQNMHTSRSDLVMVEKIIEMGHDLDMEVIAEGVETQEQFELLRSKGCDAAQGYLLSRALPPEEMVVWLANYRDSIDRAGLPYPNFAPAM